MLPTTMPPLAVISMIALIFMGSEINICSFDKGVFFKFPADGHEGFYLVGVGSPDGDTVFFLTSLEVAAVDLFAFAVVVFAWERKKKKKIN